MTVKSSLVLLVLDFLNILFTSCQFMITTSVDVEYTLIGTYR